jgi:hypothetical protein
MSGCKFNIPFSGSAEEILAKAKSAIESQGGTFTGDLNAGNFDVSLLSNTIAGSYSVEGQNLQLNIDSKPVFLPCNAIESFLIKKLG